MNWEKMLYEAWKYYYEKKKKDGENLKPCIVSFAKDYKRNIAVIKMHLQKKDYQFGKWKAVFIPKKDGGSRPLVITNSIGDNLVLKAISYYLLDFFHSLFNSVSSVSFAYQKGKSTRDALIQLKKIHNPANMLLKIDIKHFFDEIDKTILVRLLEQHSIDNYVKDLICKGINPVIDYSNLKKSDIDKFPHDGIPQGNPISAVLSNLYLYELDMLAISKKWKMVRYADDMVFSVSNKEEAMKVLSQVDEYLSEKRNLTIHPLTKSSEKTAIYMNLKSKHMKYLGIKFDGQKIYPTKECRCQLVGKIKRILQKTITLVERENELKKAIAQWCGYYAFTDITDSQIKMMNSAINYQIMKHNLKLQKVEIDVAISKARKRQNNRFLKVFHPMKYGEEYSWLNIYEQF